MEVAITKISNNGQVVIPSEIRKDAHIKPSTKYLVFNQGGNLFLKPLTKKLLTDDFELIDRISAGEEQIKHGKFTKADSDMTAEKIDELLMR